MNHTIVTHNGKDQEAVSFVPELKGELAIVHLNTIKRLASMLPKVRFEDIRDHIINGLQNADNLEHMIGMMSEEIAFHESVNLITKYETPSPLAASMEFKSSNH